MHLRVEESLHRTSVQLTPGTFFSSVDNLLKLSFLHEPNVRYSTF